MPGRSSGFTSHLHPEALDDCALPNPLPPNHPNIPQRVAMPAHWPLPRDQAQSVAGMRHNKYQDTHAENDDPKRALQDVVGNAMKGVEAKRWVSSAIAQPNTVELWVRICKVHMCHNVTTTDKWTVVYKDFVKYITRECLTSSDTVVLDCIAPHLNASYDVAPENIPRLTQCLIKLCSLDLTAAPEAEKTEAGFHAWLQELSNIAQAQYLYCSPLYSAFLKRRFKHKFQLAKESVGNRAETVRALLESATLGSLEHVALLSVQTLED
jgi:hypothetical protein